MAVVEAASAMVVKAAAVAAAAAAPVRLKAEHLKFCI